MSEPTADVAVAADGTCVTIRLTGEIDLSNADEIEHEVAVAIGNHVTRALVDVTGVSYLDSIGMRMLFKLADRLSTAQISLKVLAPPGSAARRAIDLGGLSSVVDVE